ncbi:SOS response-associated peptidase [uncultured Xylophilus sp.]|uniref:SOS response-associated peptidase n=1 Tax=uncultured Xylophilus sp. TaxID=296832 RepID=UPI0025FA790F|nr:SOS response-associated peptidase [uncultured Xylophilus sp.]
MCSHYRTPEQAVFRGTWAVETPSLWTKTDIWPGYRGVFVRRHPHADVGDEAVPPQEAQAGIFGLLPHWSKDESLAKRTYNARSETVAEKPSFRDAWRKAQHCIIPAASIYEPDWRSGKAVPTRIERADGVDLGIAGLWESWRNPAGELVYSYTMLTINADEHPLMKHYHRPGDEKRMVVILPRRLYDPWLDATADQSMDFMRPFPADRLQAHAESRQPKSTG